MIKELTDEAREALKKVGKTQDAFWAALSEAESLLECELDGTAEFLDIETDEDAEECFKDLLQNATEDKLSGMTLLCRQEDHSECDREDCSCICHDDEEGDDNAD